MGYTRGEILEDCKAAMSDVSTFYKKGFVNYRGRTTDTKELYTEVVAEFLCENIEAYKSIPRLTREASYKVEGHDGAYSESSNRIEEITAMQMLKQCKDGSTFDYIGRIIDYQTQLKKKSHDEAGKIDLISLYGGTLYILELKKEDSTETMLRCVLEGYTYLKTLDFEKLTKDFELKGIDHIKASPLVFRGSAQWIEMQEHRPQLKKLISFLDAKPYYVLKNNGKFSITEV